LNNLPLPTIKQYLRDTYENMFVYIILIPAIVLILVFTLVPLLFSALVAFTNYSKTVRIVKWIGFDAFTEIVKDQKLLRYFVDTFLWTVIWAISSSFTVYITGFINALVIESKFVQGIKIKLSNNRRVSIFGKKFWRTIFILPWAIPSMISLMTFKNVFELDGPANQLLRLTGFGGRFSDFLHTIGISGAHNFPISWMSLPENGTLARMIVLMVNLWLGWPYHMMLITGVIATISLELYEAANIDGANGWQRFRYITLPQVLISTMPSIIMTFSFNFNNFGAIYFLTGGGPNYTNTITGAPGQTDILISWIYKVTFNDNTGFYSRGVVYSILIFLLVGIFSVYNMSKTKLMQEEE
jgi:arabinogalactan oligomer/maltooligosaccharide transport system permease protein